MNKTIKQRKNFLKYCNPKINNLTSDCENGKCAYYSRCKPITRKNIINLRKK